MASDPRIIEFDLDASTNKAAVSECTARVVSTLSEGGCALLRGRIDLDGFVGLAGTLPVDYNSHWSVLQGSRQAINGDPKTMTVTEGSHRIKWHQERAWIPFPPDVLLFHCRKAPAKGMGGQTGIADGRQLYSALSPSVRDYIDTTPVVFKDEFLFESEEIRGAFLAAIGCTSVGEAQQLLEPISKVLPKDESISFEVSNERFAYEYKVSLAKSRRDGKKDAIGYFAIYEGGGRFTPTGEEYPKEILDELQETADRIGYLHEWRDGDVLIIDNGRWMHSRSAFTDQARDVILRMGWWNDGGPPTPQLRALFGASAVLG